MNPLIVGAALGLGAIAFFASISKASAGEKRMETKPNPLDEIFKKHGLHFDVNWLLLKAVATVESSLNPAAVNPRDNESVGLMQVLCRPDGAGGCSNRFDVEGWGDATRDKLLDPDFNVYIGAQILAWNLYNFGFPRGIAVFNAWDQRHAPADGPFKNQRYVDKVLAAYHTLLYAKGEK